MRDASTTCEPISISRQVPKRNPSCETSAPVTLARISRALGPQSPIVVKAFVWSTICAVPPSGAWSANHLRSALPCRPPVTTRKCSSPSRMIVRSDLNPPAPSSTGV